MQKKIMWYALSKVQGIQYLHLQKIQNELGGIHAVFTMKQSELARSLSLLRIPDKIIRQLLTVRELDYSAECDCLEKEGIHFLTAEDAAYPRRLRAIPDAPFYLYCKGKLPSNELPTLGIIGARNCSVYGREIALCFSELLAGCGIQIISGMARGIDGHAHKGALKAGGYTCGVLGFGIDVCYPQEHFRLKQELEKHGGILSEYALKMPGTPQHFPERNRLIAGLSDALLVVEAAKRSGTLITVEQALEQGKAVYAIPGRIGDRLSEGCNDIIRDGGRMVTGPEDILPEFRLKLVDSDKKGKDEKNKIILETQDKIVYACLDLQPRHVEQLILLTKMPQDELLLSLLRLETMGYVREPVKNYFIKCMHS